MLKTDFFTDTLEPYQQIFDENNDINHSIIKLKNDTEEKQDINNILVGMNIIDISSHVYNVILTNICVLQYVVNRVVGNEIIYNKNILDNIYLYVYYFSPEYIDSTSMYFDNTLSITKILKRKKINYDHVDIYDEIKFLKLPKSFKSFYDYAIKNPHRTFEIIGTICKNMFQNETKNETKNKTENENYLKILIKKINMCDLYNYLGRFDCINNIEFWKYLDACHIETDVPKINTKDKLSIMYGIEYLKINSNYLFQFRARNSLVFVLYDLILLISKI